MVALIVSCIYITYELYLEESRQTMTTEAANQQIVLAPRIKPPNWFTNLTFVTVTRKRYFGEPHNYFTVVIIKHESEIAFFPSGGVDVLVPAFKKPIVVFSPHEVLLIQRTPQEIQYNYELCLDCIQLSGRNNTVPGKYKCYKCGSVWDITR